MRIRDRGPADDIGECEDNAGEEEEGELDGMFLKEEIILQIK
jgi:hypothetical protein